MYDKAAGEIDNAIRPEKAAAPDPVCNRHIYQHEPEHAEQQEGREAHAVGDRTGDKRHGNDRKGHLVNHEKVFRDRFRQRRNCLERHAAEKQPVQRADIGAVSGETQRVAKEGPEQRNEKCCGHALSHRRKYIFLAHHAGIKQGESRNRHHQNEAGRAQHPCRVGGIDLRYRRCRLSKDRSCSQNHSADRPQRCCERQ